MSASVRSAWVAAAWVFVVGPGCNCGASVRDPTEDAGVSADATSDFPARRDGGYREGDEYNIGTTYHCCASGQDVVACCSGYPAGRCYRYGGTRRRCAQQGESVEGKDVCAHCCEGLDRVAPLAPSSEQFPSESSFPPGCGPAASDSLFVCVRCGDGVCGAGENACLCPGDCR